MPYRKSIATLSAIVATGAFAGPAAAFVGPGAPFAGPAAVQKKPARHKVASRDSARSDHKVASSESTPSGSAPSGQLQSIAQCESGGDPTAIGGGGTYRGKYQFTYETWASVGGSGDPAAAPESEQDQRAATLLAQSGNSPWPVCG